MAAEIGALAVSMSTANGHHQTAKLGHIRCIRRLIEPLPTFNTFPSGGQLTWCTEQKFCGLRARLDLLVCCPIGYPCSPLNPAPPLGGAPGEPEDVTDHLASTSTFSWNSHPPIVRSGPPLPSFGRVAFIPWSRSSCPHRRLLTLMSTSTFYFHLLEGGEVCIGAAFSIEYAFSHTS